jgi:hypothetical protein
MKKLVCNYAPIRFLPYRETGEFINLGIFAHFPEIGVFDFRLIKTNKHKRVTDFFPELDVKILRAALVGFSVELDQIRSNCNISRFSEITSREDATIQTKLFCEITRKREGLLHFGDIGTLITLSVSDAIEDLFGRFVERQFAQKREYQEIVMRKQLTQFLKRWDLEGFYEKNRKVGDDDFHVVMPFVYFKRSVANRVIRPLDLAKEEPSDIFDHGGAWVSRMARLRDRNCLPEKSIFTVNLPTSGKRLDAAKQICLELEKVGVNSVQMEDEESLRRLVSLNS